MLARPSRWSCANASAPAPTARTSAPQPRTSRCDAPGRTSRCFVHRSKPASEPVRLAQPNARSDHEHCKLCATMCRECAEDCRKALATIH
ncbi:four-helix bundle copper-binding protein [uncultured Sphingomonas sp.]|uniref:four-helix bundle copper-binding protein n=1 Tax=uncultured Sphingomonas sp. TaxID=158754 RepID=UPI0035C974B5